MISITQLVQTLGRSQVWIFIPLYLLDFRHFQYFDIGLLFFGTSMLSLPVSIYGGNLVDRLGRKKVGLIIPPLLILAFSTMAYTAFTGANILFILISFISLEPLVNVQMIVDNVLITDTVEETKRNAAYSILRIAANIGFSIGPAIGGFLAFLNYGYIFVTAAVISAFDLVLFLVYIREPKHASSAKEALSFPSGDRKFLIVCILLALIWFVSGQWGTTLTLFWSKFDHLSSTLIGVLYAVNGIFVVTMQIPVNWLFRSTSDHVRITIGGLVYSASFVALAFSSNILFLFADVFFLTIGENIISPVSYSMIGKLAPHDKRGQYFGTFQMIVGFALPFAPLLGTYMLGIFANDVGSFWVIIATMGSIISFLVLYYGRRLNKYDKASTKDNST